MVRMASNRKAELAAVASALKLVGADAELPVPLDEAGEAPVCGAYGAVQAVRSGFQVGGREELDGLDPTLAEVHDAVLVVPHPHTVGEVVGVEAVEDEPGPVLERHQEFAAARLDPSEVAEAGHERPAQVEPALPPGDLNAEDGDGPALGQPLGRHLRGPGVLLLETVEVVAPERLLVAAEAQPPFVGGAAVRRDATVEEALVGLHRRGGRAGNRGRGGDVSVDVHVSQQTGRDEAESHEKGDQQERGGAAGDPGSRHCRNILSERVRRHPPVRLTMSTGQRLPSLRRSWVQARPS